MAPIVTLPGFTVTVDVPSVPMLTFTLPSVATISVPLIFVFPPCGIVVLPVPSFSADTVIALSPVLRTRVFFSPTTIALLLLSLTEPFASVSYSSPITKVAPLSPTSYSKSPIFALPPVGTVAV